MTGALMSAWCVAEYAVIPKGRGQGEDRLVVSAPGVVYRGR
jgi:hypothetical protein